METVEQSRELCLYLEDIVEGMGWCPLFSRECLGGLGEVASCDGMSESSMNMVDLFY